MSEAAGAPGIEPSSFVDAHVHHWDLANPWYPGLTETGSDEAAEAGLHDTSGLRRNYLPADYQADSRSFQVTKIVHVSATTSPRGYLGEARWLDGLAAATGWPAAVIGTLEPADDLAQIETDLHQQAASPRFRGARVLFGLDPTSEKTDRIFGLFGGTDWVFDLVARPSEVADYLPRLERASATTFALEHAGWPEAADPAGYEHWRRGLAALAGLGNVHCKISGLPMALSTVGIDAFRPWVEGCLETFGVERCLFGSNFPVDALFGTFDEVMGAYAQIISGLPAVDRRRLFAGNAERLYRI